MIQRIPNLRARPTGKFTSTTVTNEIVEVVNSILPSFQSGIEDFGSLNLNHLVRIDSAETISGAYTGVFKVGPLVWDKTQDPDLDKMLQDGELCYIIDIPEIKKTPASHRMTTGSEAGTTKYILQAMLIGYEADDTKNIPVLIVNFGRKAWTHARIKPDGTYLQYTTVDTDTLIGLSDDDWHDEIPLTKCTATSTEALMAAMA